MINKKIFYFCFILVISFFVGKKALATDYSNYSDSFLTLNGTNSYGSIGNDLNFERSDLFYFTTFLKTNNACGSYCNIFSKQLSATTYRGYSLFITNTGKLNFQIIVDAGTNNKIEVTGNSVVNNNIWHRVQVNYTGCSSASCLTLWVDDIQQTLTVATDNITGGSIQSTANFQIGQRNNSYWLAGTVGITSVDGLLNGSSVSSYWPFNNVSGGVAPDSYQGRNMTLYNISATNNNYITILSPTDNFNNPSNSVLVAGNYVNSLGIYNQYIYTIYNVATNERTTGQGTATSTSGTFSSVINLADGIYTITAKLKNSISLIESLPSPVFHFTVGQYTQTPSSDLYAHACDDVATSTGTFDDLRYGIECGFKKIIIWSFYPTNESINSLSSSTDEFKQQFPFSAYFGLTDTITSALNTTATGTSGSIKIPFIDTNKNFVMLNVVSSSSMPNLIGQSNTTLIRTSISYIIWLSVAFLIFLTFKKI